MEAIPAFLLGFVVLKFLTDKPEKATWLKDDEREWLVNEMNAEHAAKAGTASHSIWRGLADLRVLALSLIYFGTSACLYTLGIWAPQIIKEFGLSTLQVGFLNAVPPTVAVIAVPGPHSKNQRAHLARRCCLLPRSDPPRDTDRPRTSYSAPARSSTSALAPQAALGHANHVPVGICAAATASTINSIGNLGFAGPRDIGWIKDRPAAWAALILYPDCSSSRQF